LDLNERIYIYQTDLCRTVYVTYDNNEQSHGLPGKKFSIKKSVLASPADGAEENTCFCKASEPESCYETGVFNLGACYIGAPLVGSAPHFYLSDDKYVDGVIGLNPKREKHETYIIIEDRTNVLLHVAKRVQLSFRMADFGFSGDNNLKNTILPTLWFEEAADIDDTTAADFEIFSIINIFLEVLLGISIVLVIVGAVLIDQHYRQKRKVQKV